MELANISDSLSAYSPLRRTCCAWIHPGVSTAADTHSVKPPSSNSGHSPFPPAPPHRLSPSPPLPAPRALCFLPRLSHAHHGECAREPTASEGVEAESEVFRTPSRCTMHPLSCPSPSQSTVARYRTVQYAEPEYRLGELVYFGVRRREKLADVALSHRTLVRSFPVAEAGQGQRVATGRALRQKLGRVTGEDEGACGRKRKKMRLAGRRAGSKI